MYKWPLCDDEEPRSKWIVSDWVKQAVLDNDQNTMHHCKNGENYFEYDSIRFETYRDKVVMVLLFNGKEVAHVNSAPMYNGDTLTVKGLRGALEVKIG